VYCVLEMSKDDGESSKQAVKGAKKERRAIAAALRDELEYLEDIEFSESDTDSNSESDSDATTALSLHMKKKTRGPAKIDFVALIDGKRIEVIFNEYGQPVGRNSNRLSSFIGCLVRQMVPLTLDSWHRVESDLRERLWTCVKQQFNVDGSHRRYIMSAMGRSWRNYKSVLTHKIRALVKSNDVTRKLEALKDLKPRNIKSEQQWQRFIKERV
ncbi:hypothetical protein CUMW_220650, partial [Citrus unshiu]